MDTKSSFRSFPGWKNNIGKGRHNEMNHTKIMTAKHLLLVKMSWYRKGNRIAIKRSIETQHEFKVVAAVVWIHSILVSIIKFFWPLGWIQHMITIQTGSMTRPTKTSATDKEAKNRFEIVRKDLCLQNSHNTTTFPVIAAKPDKENHTDSTMDAPELRYSFEQLPFMLSWCKVTAEVQK